MNITEKGSEMNYLAAMAVFQQMFNEEKRVQDVICSFIEYYIFTTKTYDFLLEEIYSKVNEFYNFQLPIAIVKSSLKKLDNVILKSKNGRYIVDVSKLPKNMGDSLFEENKSINDKIISELEKYVSEKIKRELTATEKAELFDGLCNFLMGDKGDSHFQKHISSFILEYSKDDEIKKQLDDINEGLIIYTGITSELDPSQLGSWKSKLTLYLDMEILFHIVGYNGEFFRQQAEDFLSLVKEINKKEKVITLLYFDSVKKEVENFFNSAEDIVKGSAISNGTVAMTHVVNGKSKPSEIITEKGKFYSKLQISKINCDEINYFDNEDNHKYCVQGEFEPMLSKINILRKGESCKAIQNIGYFLITGTRTTLSQAYSITKEKASNSCGEKYSQKSLAISLEDVTKTFWFALNKNFGHLHKLTSFDVVHKAKIVLASILNGKIKDNYLKLNKEFNDGNLTKEAVASCICELRNKPRLPEQIDPENVDSVLNLIEASDIENIQNEKALQEDLLQKTLEENKKLKNENKMMEDSIKKEREKKRENELEKERKKQRQKAYCIFVLKIVLLVVIGIFLIYHLVGFVISLDNDSKTSLGLIISIISIIVALSGVIIFLCNKFLIRPFKNKLKMIDENLSNKDTPEV